MLARTVKDAPSTPVPGVYLGTFKWHLSDTWAALGCVLLNSTPIHFPQRTGAGETLDKKTPRIKCMGKFIQEKNMFI